MERTHIFRSNQYINWLSTHKLQHGLVMEDAFDIYEHNNNLSTDYYYVMYDTRNVNTTSSQSHNIISKVLSMIPQLKYCKTLPINELTLIKKSIITHGTN